MTRIPRSTLKCCATCGRHFSVLPSEATRRVLEPRVAPGVTFYGKYGTRYVIRGVRGQKIDIQPVHGRRLSTVPRNEVEKRLA